jgi:hypothetical protein
MKISWTGMSLSEGGGVELCPSADIGYAHDTLMAKKIEIKNEENEKYVLFSKIIVYLCCMNILIVIRITHALHLEVGTNIKLQPV